jgi:hypothetical protein
MNLPEKIAGSYLRLNGFFLLPHFTIFEYHQHSHIDFLALRPPNGHEVIELNDDGLLEFPVDELLFSHISDVVGQDALEILLGGVVEIKGNFEIELPTEEKIRYAQHFFGNETTVIPITFSRKFDEVSAYSGALAVQIDYAFEWLLQRFNWMDQILPQVLKEGSWAWSEEALSDLIYIKRLL